MRLAFAFAAAALLALPAVAADTAQQTTMKTCAAKWKAVAPADQKKTTYKDYMSGCMKAPAPAMTMAAKPAAAAPTMMMAKPTVAATKPATPGPAMTAAEGKAKCKDGTVVTYKSRSGTCSGHKGVATWM
jgi:hypothetical protein